MSDVTLHKITGRSMISVRADFSSDAARKAVAKVTSTAFPEPLRMTFHKGGSVAWMAPDELLVLLPAEEAPEVEAGLSKALARQNAMVLNVADARVIYRLEGPGGRAALARLTPADVSERAFGPGSFRRTRLGQVAAGIWMREDGAIGVMCFRSVAPYVTSLLETAVASEVRA